MTFIILHNKFNNYILVNKLHIRINRFEYFKKPGIENKFLWSISFYLTNLNLEKLNFEFNLVNHQRQCKISQAIPLE